MFDPHNKRILVICQRNVVQGPIAEALFKHMGCSLFGWQVVSAGLDTNSKLNDSSKVTQILQKFAVPYREKPPQIVKEDDVMKAGHILCVNRKILEHMNQTFNCENKTMLLGSFHPDIPDIEIQDPSMYKDPKSYEKCYWLIYKSMKIIIKKLKQIDEENKPKREKKKILKLHDPTIWTITSPSAWQKNKLSSPDIIEIDVHYPILPQETIIGNYPKDVFEEPQLAIPDYVEKLVAMIPIYKCFQQDDFESNIVFIPFQIGISESVNFDLYLSPPQSPPQEHVKDTINYPSKPRKVLNDMNPPLIDFYTNNESIPSTTYERCNLRLSPPGSSDLSQPVTDKMNARLEERAEITDKKIDDPSHYCCTQGTDTKLEAKTRIPKLFVKSLLENVFRLSPPPLNLDPEPTELLPMPRARARGDLFDEVRVYRKPVFSRY